MVQPRAQSAARSRLVPYRPRYSSPRRCTRHAAPTAARDTGARAVRISDGGITGPAFFDHVRRSRRPIINSPKGQTAPLPPDLIRRPVIAPQVYWTWSLVWRRGEERAAVLAVVDALTGGVGDLGIHRPDAWLPDSDPHKQ